MSRGRKVNYYHYRINFAHINKGISTTKSTKTAKTLNNLNKPYQLACNDKHIGLNFQNAQNKG